MTNVTALYTMLALTVVIAVFFGYLSSQNHGVNKATTFGCSAFFGMVFITGIYRAAGPVFYPEHEQIFKTMDGFVFRVAVALIIGWMVGVLLLKYVQSRPPVPRMPWFWFTVKKPAGEK